MPLNTFDSHIIHFLNQFVHKSYLFDECIVFLSNCQMLKGGVLMTGLWWVWFKEKDSQSDNREHIISTLLGSFIAMFIVRVLASRLPFRSRPILNPANHLVEAYSLNKDFFDNLSSFPSDHATMFYALSAGLLYSSKKVGTVALIYTTLFIAFPRVYLGLHYPTDILGGALVGIVTVMATNINYVEVNFSRRLIRASKYKEHVFYPLFFLFTYQIADMFISTRNIITFLTHLIFNK